MLLVTISFTILLSYNVLICSQDIHSTFANEIKTDTANDQDFEELGLHYGKYLKEVVAALDKDQKFTETIKNMDTNDIKSGKVAEQLKHVHEDVRKKLNDLKYLEIKRLRDLATRKNEMNQFGETYHGTDKRKWRTLGASLSTLPKDQQQHIGSDDNYFDVNDLHKLMVAATNDLEKLDKERKEDYKTYELEKEWQFQERLKMMNETERQEATKARQKLKEKHEDHPKVHEPGSRSQFVDVWEKKDHLPAKEFDPKTFFTLHDTNSDNYWDQQEVRNLLVTEINKMYDPNNPEDDPNEMEEEYERMREHIYKIIDTDRDGLISITEFIEYSKKPEFKQDQGWDDLSKKDAFSKQDYEDYIKNRDKIKNSMHGHYDPSYYANQPSNMHLPDWGLGMPAGAHPSQYYGYQVDPHAHQIMAQQQQMAYHQQAAYHQQVAAGGYQAVPQHQQYAQPAAVPAVGHQQYQAPPVQNNQYQPPPQQQQQQPQQQQPAQVAYNPPQQQQQQQAIPQQQQAYSQPPALQQPAQGSYQQIQQPQQQVPQQQQNIPQQQVPMQQQQQQPPPPPPQQQQQQQQAPPR